MYCNRLHVWWSTKSRLATLLSSLISHWWIELQTLCWFPLKSLSIDEMVGAWCFGCLWVHRVLPVGFLLLWYSVLFTVESLSLLYLLFISWFICSRRWCINKLGVFHANQISMYLDPHLNWGWGRRYETGLSPPPCKIFYWPFLGGTSFVDHLCFFCLVFAMPLCASVYLCLVVTCWERADLLALVCGVQLWVCHFPIGLLGCGTWLYQFLIFAPLLPLILLLVIKIWNWKKKHMTSLLTLPQKLLIIRKMVMHNDS